MDVIETRKVTIDGEEFSLGIFVDYDTNLLDEQGEDMWCGRIEWQHPSRYYSIDYVGQRSAGRPDGFDGNAEILLTDHGSALWWQVPADVKRGTESYTALRRTILDILEYGYVGLMLADDDDNSAAVWGVESCATWDENELRLAFLNDLASEVRYTRQESEDRGWRDLVATVGWAGQAI